MKNRFTPLFALLCCLSLFSACKDEPIDPPVCPEVWTLVNQQSGVTTFADSKLSIDFESGVQSGVALMLSQDSLRGDFRISLAYEALDTGDTGLGAFMQLLVGNGSTTAPFTAKASVGNVSPAGAGMQVGAVIDSSGQNPGGSTGDFDFGSGSAGTLTISRTGSMVTCTATLGTAIISQTRAFNAAACAVVIQVGSNYQSLTGHFGVRLTTFTVTGGGGAVKADDFGCDSFK